jgi:hypothetical protein
VLVSRRLCYLFSVKICFLRKNMWWLNSFEIQIFILPESNISETGLKLVKVRGKSLMTNDSQIISVTYNKKLN